MSRAQTERLIREAVYRLAEGDEHGTAARILADLAGLDSALRAAVHERARDLAIFSQIMASAEEHNAPIFEADPSRRT